MQSDAGLNERRIDAALPPDVWTEGLGRFAAYQRYPRYTLPWFRRRAYVLWPFAAAHGICFGIWHAASMQTWGDAFPLGSRGVVASILTVSIGPLLAMLVRYRRLLHRTEAVLVVVAIIVGVLVSHLLQQWVADYHDMLMGHHDGRQMQTSKAIQSVSETIGMLVGELPYWLGLFLVGGGWELKSYLAEQRLLAEHSQRRDLELLRADKAATDLRLSVLQAQIEPHFLFNTLASMRSLARTDPERTAATIDALAAYLRTVLPRLRQDGVQSATLGQQLDICSAYLELMRVRVGARLRVVVDVPSELRAMAFPPLLLIPLVENAVKHGVEPSAEPVVIALRARVCGTDAEQKLQVDVEDDGVGLSESAGAAGLGLANIRSQLEHRFGNAATLTVCNRRERGVCSTIVVPVKPA